MLALYEEVAGNPAYFKQFNYGEMLIAKYDCPLEEKYVDIWSKHNYIVYVIEGRKIWHTAHGSFDLTKDSCVLVRKGACIVEQFFNPNFCLVIFFLPDEFICDVLKTKKTPLFKPGQKFDPIIPIQTDGSVNAFFQSMMAHFMANKTPDPSLLEIKFRELVLTIADNAKNAELLSYFSSLLHEPQTVTLQRVMEENYCYNLKLEEFARLSNRSLSAFKRDFQKLFDTTPGKWLLEKRLDQAMHLLINLNKTVTDAAFETGFENPSHFSRAFRQRFGYSPAQIKHQLAV